MKKNEGFTLIETLVAFVIISVILVVLTNGIIATSSWIAKSEKIKTEGQTVADNVEGTADGDVETSSEKKQITLTGSGGSISLAEDSTQIDTYQYKDSDLVLKDMNTAVADHYGGSTGYYEESRSQQADNVSAMKEFLAYINTASASDLKKIGLSGAGATKDNATLIKALGKWGYSWPSLSDEFMTKHNLSQKGNVLNHPVLRGYYYDLDTEMPSEVIYIASHSANDIWRAYMIYVDSYWYLAPTTGNAGDYVNFQMTSYSSAQQLLTYIKDENNGWQKLLPVTE